MGDLTELALLFGSAFLAATIFPAQSEAVIVGLHMVGSHYAWVLVAVATAGNVLGAVLNWVLGRFCIHYRDRPWFPIKPNELEKPTKIFQKWGVWCLLFAWLPIIGDALTLIAGIFRIRILPFLILVTVGKAARYIVLLAMV